MAKKYSCTVIAGNSLEKEYKRVKSISNYKDVAVSLSVNVNKNVKKCFRSRQKLITSQFFGIMTKNIRNRDAVERYIELDKSLWRDIRSIETLKELM